MATLKLLLADIFDNHPVSAQTLTKRFMRRFMEPNCTVSQTKLIEVKDCLGFREKVYTSMTAGTYLLSLSISLSFDSHSLLALDVV